jgi:hypothetical protein
MRLPLLVITAAALSAAAVPAVAADGRLDSSGARLTGERSGEHLCLTLVEPSKDLRLRRCLLGARAGVIRTSYVFDPIADGACDFETRLFGIAPRGTVKVNLGGVLPDGRAIALKRFGIPASRHPARGVAFVVRRNLAGTTPTLTAYGADGQQLAQRKLGPFPIPGCVKLKTPVPGR